MLIRAPVPCYVRGTARDGQGLRRAGTSRLVTTNINEFRRAALCRNLHFGVSLGGLRPLMSETYTNTYG